MKKIKRNLLQILMIAAASIMLSGAAAIFGQDKNPLVDRLFDEAEKYLDTGNYTSAIANYDKIIKLDPTNPDAYNGRGFAYLGNKNYDGAIADFTKTLELKPDDFYTYYSRGKAYFLKGDYARSIEDHTKELDLQPIRAIGRLERGNALMKLGRTDEAIADFNGTIVFSDMAAGYYSRALAFQAKGDTKSAMADLRYYLGRVPDDERARQLFVKLGAKPGEIPAPFIREKLTDQVKKAFGEVFGDLEQAYYNEAVFKLNDIIKANPKSAGVYFYRGYILEIQASELNALKTIADYTKAIALDPKFVDAYINRAFRYSFTNTRAKAVTDLTRALMLDPRSVRAVYYTGLRYMYAENWPKALASFNQALKLDPVFVDGYIARADVYESTKQYDKAAADYSAIIGINANDYRAYSGRAKVYCEQNKKTLAAVDEKKVIELGGEPDSPCGE